MNAGGKGTRKIGRRIDEPVGRKNNQKSNKERKVKEEIILK